MKMSILRKPSENMKVLRYRKLCLSQMDRCVKAVRLERLRAVLKETHLKMEEK